LILWDVVRAHLSLQLCPNGSEAADDPRVERYAIHGIKPDPELLNEGDDTFGSSRVAPGSMIVAIGRNYSRSGAAKESSILGTGRVDS
jgi:hypothetical protein